MSRVTAIRLTVLAACWMAGSLTTLNPVEAMAADEADLFSPEAMRPALVAEVEISTPVTIEATTELDTPIVIDMAAFGCDGEPMDQFVAGLFADGWRADGVAESYGEALADETGSVVVTFSC